ncbi:MAG: hypothetical protein M3452_11430 [Chloroflexota bacterium]|nr:hypothetical protein [Chloroflexota bacterium]
MPDMLRVARLSLWVAAVAFLVLGVVAWLVPGFASERFPWSVSPFLAMTIGGWSIGSALFAADAARDLRPDRAYPLVIYLGVFGLGQLLVAFAFVDRLRLEILTWPYLVGLWTALIGSVLAFAAWRQAPRDTGRPEGRLVPAWGRVVVMLFVLFVSLLALGTLIAGPEGAIAQGSVFPEPMSLFSIRAFSAFLFALTVASASLLFTRQALPYHELARAGLYLIVPITIAAFLNLPLFVPERPLTLFYLAAYVGIGLGLCWVLWLQRGDPTLHPRNAGRASADP